MCESHSFFNHFQLVLLVVYEFLLLFVKHLITDDFEFISGPELFFEV